MNELKVVAVIVEFRGKFLFAKRANYMPRHPGLWGVISGVIEKNETPEKAALRELFEETKLKGEIEKVGKEFVVEDSNRYFVAPILVKVESRKAILNSEHSEMKWIYPNEIWDFQTVPMLEKDFESVGISVGMPPKKSNLAEF
ncbi:MAG: NUDIX domain-containing protein [archaeon]